MQHFIQVARLSHSIALFLSLENEVGRLFKLMRMGGGVGGGGWLSSKGVSNQVGPFLNFPPPFFFLRIGLTGLTVEINLTAKKLLKIAIRTT